VAEDTPNLRFRPSQDEYSYLLSTGIIKTWAKQCHLWIKNDRQDSINRVFEERTQRRIDVIESVRNGLLLIGMGILILLISQGSLLMIPEIVVVIHSSAIASVVIGFITIFYRRKKLDGRTATADARQ
jgi:hypothetical protein